MRISVELSLYPLDDKFLPIIQDIVERITGDKRVEAIVNTMSTQIFGDFESVMAVVNETVEYSFRTYGKQVFVAKFLNSDVKPD
ncbi:hypothetical protein DL796_03865 [Kangiella spongicola]|uniref:Thiamine-binding protein domain-containing protein n=2 Tax=Kangiella spongicola TaxID=796379 RepID=A0A318D604_9GAMM|nr:hypothetical protein DL796_03865 [Kangiella spongicola]